MNKSKRLLILLNLVIVFGLLGWSVLKKEHTLSKGKLVLLELAPVDPRSLMQGDYMQLNYAIAQINYSERTPKTGYVIVMTDSSNVARRVRTQAGKEPLQPGEIAIRYTLTDNGMVNVGAGSYFFEEGHAERFAKAKFGGLKVDGKGECILVGLFDEQHRLLQP